MPEQYRIVCAKHKGGTDRHSYHVYAYGNRDKADQAVQRLNDDDANIAIPARRDCKPWRVQQRTVGEWA